MLPILHVPYIPKNLSAGGVLDVKGIAASNAFDVRSHRREWSQFKNAAGAVVTDLDGKICFVSAALSAGEDSHSEILLLMEFFQKKLKIQKTPVQTNREFIFKNIDKLSGYKITIFTERAPCNIYDKKAVDGRKYEDPDKRFFDQITCEVLLREIAFQGISITVYFSVPNAYGNQIDNTMKILLRAVQAGRENKVYPSLIRRCIFDGEDEQDYIKNIVLFQVQADELQSSTSQGNNKRVAFTPMLTAALAAPSDSSRLGGEEEEEEERRVNSPTLKLGFGKKG